MKKQEKLKLLRRFKEKPLIDNVIISLLEKMGFKNITVTHGSLEKGKDLLFYKENEFEEREYTGVQVKAVDIHGRGGEKGNATEILNQAQQAFTHGFQDTYDNKTKNIDRYIVMTSGNITEAAKESIGSQLKAVGCYKTIQFFDGNKLVDLVDKWIPDFFWEEYNYFNRYFKQMKKDFETIKEISAIGQKEPIGLEDIYVSLKLCEKASETDLPMESEISGEVDEILDEKSQEKRYEGRIVKKELVFDPETAIKQYKRLVIVGEPGAGKTTLLKHLALKYCKENIEKQKRVMVPVPITLREFFQGGKGLREYIDVVFNKYEFPKAREFVEKDLKSGKCIILLDGFDELATRENQRRVLEEIHAFTNQYPRCKFIVTSRSAGYRDELHSFTRLEVMAFDKEQIKHFIENWFGSSNRKRAESMLKAVMDNKNILDLAKNPLMISIIAIIYEEDQELPQRRADLYRRAVEVLLSRWEVAKKLKSRFSPDQKEFILRELAYKNHCCNRRTMTKKEILKEIAAYSSRIGLKEEDIKQFLEEIWQRSYILKQISFETYDFLHLSFQEYFTALKLNELEEGIDTIISHLSELWWEEPILLYASLKKDAGPLIKRIQNEVPEDIFCSNLLLFGKCIADAEFTEPELKENIIQKLWSLYNSGEFPLIRYKARDVLRRIKPPNIINSLIEQLTDKKSHVRRRSAEALGGIGRIEVIPALVKTLTTDKENEVRRIAADALGNIGSAEAIPALVKALTTDKEYHVRGSAADALGGIGNAEAAPALMQTFNTDKESYVRWRASEALGGIGSTEAIPALVKALTTDIESDIRGYAVEALRDIGSAEAIPDLVKTFTTDKESYVRGLAAYALGSIGSSEAIPALVKALITDKESDVRGLAADALGSIGRAEAIPALEKALTTDKDSHVRGSAADALGGIGSSEAIPALVKTLTTDKVGEVRRIAADALGSIGRAEAIPALVKTLSTDKESDVRGGAAEALGSIGSAMAVTALVKLLTTDNESEVRQHVASALGAIASPETIPYLIQSLTMDENTDVRMHVVSALGKIRSIEAISELIQTLVNDNDIHVRIRAAEALGSIGRAEAIPALIEALTSDKNSDVRLCAAEALGNIEKEDVIQSLMQALKDKGEYLAGRVKDSAFEALYKISRRLGVRILPDNRGQMTNEG